MPPRRSRSRRSRAPRSRRATAIGHLRVPNKVGTAPYGRSTDINTVVPRPTNGPVGYLRIKRASASALLFTSSTTVDVLASYYFTLDGMAGYTDFTALFDQYKINSVWVEAVPSSDQLNGEVLNIAIDYDDATATSVSNLLQYNSLVRVPYGKTFTVPINRPAVDVLANATGSATRAAVNRRSPWLDCGAADVQHYGLKIGSSPTPAGARTYNLMFFYDVTFRAVR